MAADLPVERSEDSMRVGNENASHIIRGTVGWWVKDSSPRYVPFYVQSDYHDISAELTMSLKEAFRSFNV